VTSVAAHRAQRSYTADEMMTVEASRALHGVDSCFVGIGLPSTAANLARTTHSPDLVLVYESGCLGSKPGVLPLSIGDGVLADTATAVVSVPEIFNYWLQPGRIQVGFLSAAQIDKRGNINTTVIGPYDNPKVRLPGAGGAPEIPASCAEVIVVVRHSTRVFVNEVGFVTSVGFGRAKGDRQKYGLRGKGPQRIITDLSVLQPDADGEFILTAIHPGVSVEQVKQATGWDLRVATELSVTPEPTKQELRALRHLETTKGQS